MWASYFIVFRPFLILNAHFIRQKIRKSIKVKEYKNHADKEERKKEFKYYCESCDIDNFFKIIIQITYRSKRYNDYFF